MQAGGKDLTKGLTSTWWGGKEQKYKSVLFITRLFVWVQFFQGRRRKKKKKSAALSVASV